MNTKTIRTWFDHALLILKNYKAYKDFNHRKKGHLMVDFKRGCGYYITVGLLGCDPKDKLHTIPMQSGRDAICKLISYETFRDPWDMVKTSSWQLLGYRNMKLISECTFEEYVEFYGKKP